MFVRVGTAIWHGDLKTGNGRVSTGSGLFKGAAYSAKTRFGDAPGTNPEELLGAAHASCFSMALAAELQRLGYHVTSITTKDRVSIDKVADGYQIKKIDVDTVAIVKDITYEKFNEVVEKVKVNCPVSRALKGVEIEVYATIAEEETALPSIPV